jgi:S-DNA-T family DNA segregation ATPase FtsK/SpoIIIE
MSKKKDKFKRNKLPLELKAWVTATLAFLGAAVITLSFFSLAGTGGIWINRSLRFLIGKTALVLPIFLFGLGITILLKKKSQISWRIILLQISLLLIGVSGILATQGLIRLESNIFHQQYGGWIGWVFAWPIFNFFGEWVCSLVFITFFAMGGIIFVYPLWLRRRDGKDVKDEQQENKIKQKEKETIKINNKDFKEPRVNWIQAKQFVKKQKKEKILSPSQSIKRQLAARTVNLGQEDYQLPSIEFLVAEQGSPETGSIKNNSAIIKSTFSDFGIEIRMAEVNVGPTVTQYALRPPEGVRLSKITSLSKNLALALAAHPIRMEAPIPGRSLVGIEVPNKTRVLVRLRNLIEDPKFINGSPLELCLGRDVAGAPVYADLGKMPHLLVAGATGSGKTVALNSLITSLLYKNTPAQTKLLLIDPKRVEFSLYNGLPHLLTPVISNPDEVIGALEWLIEEMERRFTQILRLQVRDIKNYNKIAQSNKSIQPLPYIVLVIDELADLMATKGREIESAIVRLAQKSRAVGIHLIIATQRPSVEVMTGLIKANITCRMAFQVASQIDSRTIIDVGGAEKLLGDGDMLFLSPERTKSRRVQGVFLSEKEVLKVVRFFKKSDKSVKEESSLEKNLKESLKRKQQEGVMSFGEDSLYEDARDLVLESERASASFLQRRLRIGYARAARLLDMLEAKGIIGPGQGSKPRKINYSFQEEENNEEEKG